MNEKLRMWRWHLSGYCEATKGPQQRSLVSESVCFTKYLSFAVDDLENDTGVFSLWWERTVRLRSGILGSSAPADYDIPSWIRWSLVHACKLWGVRSLPFVMGPFSPAPTTNVWLIVAWDMTRFHTVISATQILRILYFWWQEGSLSTRVEWN